MEDFVFKKRDLLSGPHLLGAILLFAGSFVLILAVFLTNESLTDKAIILGVGCMILGLMILSSYRGTCMDTKEKRFKKYFSICGYKSGKWATLPQINAVKVLSISYRNTNTPNGISPTLSGTVVVFKILLYSNDAEPVLEFVYLSGGKATRDAKYLASNLNADLI